MRTGLEKPTLGADEAVARIPDGATVAIGGSGSGHCIPDVVLAALGRRFVETGHPNSLTLVHAFGVGDQKVRGLQHLAHAGMFRRVVGGHWSMAPAMGKLAAANDFEAYNIPAGVIVQLFHAAAAGSPGWITHVGLGTFMDPRLEGGKLNARAQQDIVELMEHNGEEFLFYPAIAINVALIQGSVADTHGNIGMRREQLRDGAGGAGGGRDYRRGCQGAGGAGRHPSSGCARAGLLCGLCRRRPARRADISDAL
ncbi:MAG: hypothetical protein O2968_05675 [Acidobacteria bacterium]|nr:hypothetical protein [Acidobacteriota bacterium]